jgi:hypothetical protein
VQLVLLAHVGATLSTAHAAPVRALKQFKVPTANCEPRSTTNGSDGNLWFTLGGENANVSTWKRRACGMPLSRWDRTRCCTRSRCPVPSPQAPLPMFQRGRLDHFALSAASEEAFWELRRRLVAPGR